MLPFAMAILLFAATLLAAHGVARHERGRADDKAGAAAERAAAATELALATASGSLAGAAGLFEASENVRPDEFAAFARRVLGRGGLAAVGWVERVPARERAAWEERNGLTIVEPALAGMRPAPARADHFPVTYLENGRGVPGNLGLDPTTEPTRRAALERAAASGGTSLTAPVRLYGSGVRGVILFQPVYRGDPATPAARIAALRGFIAGSYPLETLVGQVERTVGTDTPVEIRDGDTLLSPPVPAAAGGRRVELAAQGREWSVQAAPPPRSWMLSALILVSGGVLTLLAMALAVVIGRRDRFATAAVDRATSELHESEDRYRALVASLSDGVVVHGASGEIIDSNPAAAAILGLAPDELRGRGPDVRRWRAIREDGSPLPLDEHPLALSLRTGRPLDGRIMGVHRPDGALVWLSVSTRPRDEEGGRNVVVCFTDITARVEADREQAALRRVATAVAADAATAEVLDMVAREAAELIGAEAAGVVRFEEGLHEGAVVGVHAPGHRAAEHGRRFDLTIPTAAGRVAATGEIARLDEDGPLHPNALIPDVTVSSAVAAPIRVENQLWGAIAAVTTREDAPLAPGTGDRLGRLGDLVALAIMSSDARAQLATLAGTDDLTGLPNRRAFTERLATEIERSRRYGRPVSLVMIDIDRFKAINDAHGHPAGDRVLKGVAAQLFGTVREAEMVARIGGEEFAWILPETTSEAAARAADRVRRQIARVVFDGVGSVTLSMGVCDVRDAHTPSDMLRLADAALYRAKEAGRDRVVRHVPARRPATTGPPATRV